MLELHGHDGVFKRASLLDIDQMLSKLRGTMDGVSEDPDCRLSFLQQAGHCRAALEITKDMFLALLSHHQVMPPFLDFCFPFGDQEEKFDFNFSSFRYDERLSADIRGPALSSIGRSGSDIQLCYNLKSVERNSLLTPPWSVEQVAVYQYLDIETYRTNWILVKGDDLIQSRFETATQPGGKVAFCTSRSRAENTLASVLESHLIVADWSTEGWRWYVKSLEDDCQRCTNPATYATIGRRREALGPGTTNHRPQTINTTNTSGLPANPLKTSRAVSWSRLKSKISTMKNKTATIPMSSRSAYPPPAPPEKEFQIKDLQSTQHIEDRVDEALLSIKFNIDILTKLSGYFERFIGCFSTQNGFGTQECKDHVSRFQRRITSIVDDLHLHQTRLEAVVRQLGNRKTLLSGIIDYQNMIMNQSLAEKAQHSANKMEQMTKEMHLIARRTEQETVSMKVITIITLLFLPGTFISTLMSTDIVRFPENTDGGHRKSYSSEALELYVAITLPLLILTLGVAWIIYHFSNRKKTRCLAALSNDVFP